MDRVSNERTAFRCLIPKEQSNATLRVGSKRYPCNVLDTSRNSFSVRLPAKLKSSVGRADHLELLFNEEHWVVDAESSYSTENGFIVFGLSRQQDLTKLKVPKSSGFGLIGGTKTNADPSFIFALILALLFACICLPGIGDKLGTAPKVKKGLHSLYESMRDTVK